MLRGRGGLMELGVALLLLGFGVKLALMLGALLNPIANIAMIAGIVVIVINAIGGRNR